MNKGLAVLCLAAVCSVPMSAQDRDRSLERISLALSQPATVKGSIDLTDTTPKTFGIFTLVQPQLPGEMIRISVPIGDLVSRAFRGVAAANRRRQERAARREVESALARLERPQKP